MSQAQFVLQSGAGGTKTNAAADVKATFDPFREGEISFGAWGWPCFATLRRVLESRARCEAGERCRR